MPRHAQQNGQSPTASLVGVGYIGRLHETAWTNINNMFFCEHKSDSAETQQWEQCWILATGVTKTAELLDHSL